MTVRHTPLGSREAGCCHESCEKTAWCEFSSALCCQFTVPSPDLVLLHAVTRRPSVGAHVNTSEFMEKISGISLRPLKVWFLMLNLQKTENV